MDTPDRCELHETALGSGRGDTESLLELEHSPIGAECQRCSVCRWARTFIERRLAERGGRMLPKSENADTAWAELQAALRAVRSAVRTPG